MKLNDERRKALNKYLGEPYTTSEYTVANSGDLVSVRTVIQNRTFTTDADMMALFRKMVDESQLHGADSFLDWADTVWDKAGMKIILDDDENFISWLFYDPERFCNLVAEWLEVKK